MGIELVRTAARISAPETVALETIERTGQHRPIRLLVIDSHPLVRWALTQIAQERSDLVNAGEGASAEEAIAIAFTVHPDVATIECSAADCAGWELAAKLRATYPSLGIVILTTDASDQMLFRALDVGASAFLSKSAPISDVLAAIRHAAVSPRSFTAAGLAAALQRKRETPERLTLSPREREILTLLRDGMSVPAIALQLYVSLSTAKTYVARLYEKLGARNRAQALMTAVRLGMFEEQLVAVG
jgi:DNA-binding NarL/FixJ family response regulator